jgi:hypothetical protein
MSEITQAYANHRRYDPIYHGFVFGVLALNVLVAIWYVVRAPSFPSFWSVLVAVALVVLFFKARMYPLVVQDRVIRLEERLRLAQLLPDPLKSRIGELTPKQLTGLRFASDAEVPGLVGQALAENLSGEEIKKRIRTWRPDTLRV